MRAAFVAILLFFSFAAAAQLKAGFNIDKQDGCAPLLVHFTNATTGASPNATYQWDFGNGSFSTLKDAGAIFQQEASYSITLTVKDGSQTSSKTATVTVHKKPTVDFVASLNKGCVPLPVTFTANATAGDGAISSYDWDFGDGNTEHTVNNEIIHTYNTVQKAGASVTVTNSFGCYATAEKQSLVDIKETLTADFAANSQVLCRETDAVQFSNASNGPGTLRYVWDFGDGNTSTLKEPSHAFGKKGLYSVALTVQSSEGCTSTIRRNDYLNVAAFKTAFDIPLPVCKASDVVFENKSKPDPSSSVWLVDGNPAYAYTPSLFYTFYAEGKHSVVLKNAFGTCIDSIEKTVDVQTPPILNGFLSGIMSNCGAPVKVSFKDTTATAVKWAWTFDSYSTQATEQAPSYTFSYDNAYYVTLEITNAAGCKASIGKPVYISRPSVTITSPDAAPNSEILSCGFKDIHFTTIHSEPIASYQWSFGDNTTSTDSMPVHRYNKTGDYFVTLSYTTVSGCQGETKLEYPVVVRTKPKADFTISQTTICGNTPVLISDNTTIPADVPYNYYYHQWTIGNNNFQATTGEYYKLNYQFQDSGTYDITLIVTDLVCADTMVKKGYVKVLPPFPKIGEIEHTCDGTRGLVTFNQSSRLATGWQWDFGDGATFTPTTDQPTVQHTYDKTGWYRVVLSTTNGQCTVKDSAAVTVLLKQYPILTADKTEVCSRDDFLQITVSNLERNPAVYNYYGYSYGGWYHTDGSFAPGQVSSGDLTAMPFTMSLWDFQPGKSGLQTLVRGDVFNCVDTTNWIPLKIKGPIVSFKTIAKPCTSGNTVYFQDASVSPDGLALKTWDWDFGDGTHEIRTSGTTFKHTYPWRGGYFVTLTVTDASGCHAIYQQEVSAENNSLNASFTSSATLVSPGTTVTFTNTSASSEPDNTSYKWFFSDGTSATTNDASKTYSQPGVYTVKLIAVNTLRGCTDTALVTITVKYVNAAFNIATSPLNNAKCPPMMVQFTNTSANVSGIEWDFGDGATSTLFSPSHIYTKAGKYYVKAKAFSDNGSVYTTVDSVFIGMPSVQLTADKTSGCTAQTISFNAAGAKEKTYWWDFGDGAVMQTTDSTTSHFYNASGTFAAGVMVSDDGGCTASAQLPQRIFIDSLALKINTPLTKICAPKQLAFEAAVTGVSTQTAVHYHWNWGTGNSADTSALQRPDFVFAKPGTYAVQLTASTNSGCIKQATETITAFQGLGGVINGPAAVCEGKSIQLTGATTLPGQPQWQWIFDDGLTSMAQNPQPKTYNTPGIYPVVLVVNNNGCADTITKMVTVNPKPQTILSLHMAVVCEGSSLTLTAANGNTYQWSPAVGLNTTTGATVVATPKDNIAYNVVATTNKGCSNTDSVLLNVIHPLHVSLATNAAICQGDALQLNAAGADVYSWIGSTATLSNTTIPSPIAHPTATTTYTVVGADAQGCFKDTASIAVTVKALPTVDAGPDMELLAGMPAQLNAATSSDVVRWNWSPADYLSCTACASPQTKPLQSLTYVVSVQNSAGCTAKDSVSIALLCSGSRIFIPNSFTPNRDGKNDHFRIKAEGIKEVKSLRIYNRWGEMVFERTNFLLNDDSAAWDGKYKGQLVPAGTYVYLAELTCNESHFQQKGTVTVVY